jgi:predicted nucleotidyltransferase|tara:strand:- start:1326 stop:2501 length:1176 start_codon:yes stop_codon:yes gene_type:complete
MKAEKLWKIFEQGLKTVNLSSFELNDELNSNIWDSDDNLNPDVKYKLLKIAEDFIKNLGIEGIEYTDITITGSIANYNWSKFSDIDLHIVLDFSKLNKDIELVREFFRGKFGMWNKTHDIIINEFEVEIYVQDSNEPHVSTGVYSVLHNSWLIKPSRETFEIDAEDTKKKALKFMDMIDSLEDLFNDKKYDESYDFSKKLKKKIKKFRQCGLEKGGQYSAENLAFKVLRRNGYLGKLSGLATDSYDKMMSILENLDKKWHTFCKNFTKNVENSKKLNKNNNLTENMGISWQNESKNIMNDEIFEDFSKKVTKKHDLDEMTVLELEKLDRNLEKAVKNGTFSINEIEPYQRKVRKKHSRMKKRLIGKGKQPNKPPYTKKPSSKRGKSGPPGA